MEFAAAIALTVGIATCAARGAYLTMRRRGEFVEGLALGLLLGPVGVGLAGRLPRMGRSQLTQRDRHCFQMIARFEDRGARFSR